MACLCLSTPPPALPPRIIVGGQPSTVMLNPQPLPPKQAVAFAGDGLGASHLVRLTK